MRLERKRNWIILIQLHRAIKTNLSDRFIEKRENFRKAILLKYYSI
jgi:hypothetical protein